MYSKMRPHVKDVLFILMYFEAVGDTGVMNI